MRRTAAEELGLPPLHLSAALGQGGAQAAGEELTPTAETDDEERSGWARPLASKQSLGFRRAARAVRAAFRAATRSR